MDFDSYSVMWLSNATWLIRRRIINTVRCRKNVHVSLYFIGFSLARIPPLTLTLFTPLSLALSTSLALEITEVLTHWASCMFELRFLIFLRWEKQCWASWCPLKDESHFSAVKSEPKVQKSIVDGCEWGRIQSNVVRNEYEFLNIVKTWIWVNWPMYRYELHAPWNWLFYLFQVKCSYSAAIARHWWLVVFNVITHLSLSP